jgi:hypothetical protein
LISCCGEHFHLSSFVIFWNYFLPEGVISEVKANFVISSIYEHVNIMISGVSIGIVFIGLIGRLPREMVISILGKETGFAGIFRATIGGCLTGLMKPRNINGGLKTL